jgi:uncharacterized protein (DUF608 family)
VLRGIQPSTHDIDLAGVNSFMGTLWLAALRAEQEMARLLGDGDREKRADDLFRRGSAAYDEQLFNGEYYVQRLDPDDPQEFQWGPGCLADQLIGQWWAHELDLGHVLPAEHVRTALRSVVRYNLRQGFSEFSHGYRVFADQDDTGLLMCTWPLDGRPEVPTRYADEVWTGSEYQVAAHCFYEGLVEEGRAILDGLWRRYDGTRRNPYNEIECGDHYARAMAGWSLVNAAGGLSFDATDRVVTAAVNGGGGGRLPLVLDAGWGEIEVLRQDGEDTVEVSVVLRCTRGEFDLRAVRVRGEGATVDISVPGSITAGDEMHLNADLRS